MRRADYCTGWGVRMATAVGGGLPDAWKGNKTQCHWEVPGFRGKESGKEGLGEKGRQSLWIL